MSGGLVETPTKFSEKGLTQFLEEVSQKVGWGVTLLGGRLKLLDKKLTKIWKSRIFNDKKSFINNALLCHS